MASLTVIGATGRQYIFKKLIQERAHVGRVWLATSGLEQFILKDVPEKILSSFNVNILPRLSSSPFLRLPLDSIPNRCKLVYQYLDSDFLNLVKAGIPLTAKKRVLRTCLQGIAEMHDRDVVHLDIKPDNIMVNYHYSGQEVAIEKVQVADLENAAYLPNGRCIKGMPAGNENWRSPEAHFKGELSKPSDIFSFAVTCIYSVLERVIFGADDDFQIHQAHGALPAVIRLQRQVSYFGDQEGLNGLVRHVGDEVVNCDVLQMLWEERIKYYRPFTEWTVSDALFKDLIGKMTNLNPGARITARQALEHPWFSEI